MMVNNYGVSRRALLGVGGLMLGVGLVGCSDSEGEVDSSWESVTVGRITVSHPKEWVEKPPENENFTKNFADGPHGMQIAGHYSADTEPTLAWSVLKFMISGTFEGYHAKGYQEITIKGAAKAIKCPFDFTDKGKSARGYWRVINESTRPHDDDISDTCCNDSEQYPQNNVKHPRPLSRCRRRQSRVRPC